MADLVWRITDLPDGLKELPETGALFDPADRTTYSIAKAAKAAYNAAFLSGASDPTAAALKNLRSRGIIQ